MKHSLLKSWLSSRLFASRAKCKSLWGGKWETSKWWKDLCSKFKKETGQTVDRNDPEYDAQKIYMHWIKSFK